MQMEKEIQMPKSTIHLYARPQSSTESSNPLRMLGMRLVDQPTNWADDTPRRIGFTVSRDQMYFSHLFNVYFLCLSRAPYFSLSLALPHMKGRLPNQDLNFSLLHFSSRTPNAIQFYIVSIVY